MFFLEQPEIIVKANELDTLNAQYRQETCKSVGRAFDTYEMNDFYTFGISALIRADARRIAQFKQPEWDALNATFTSLHSNLVEFVDALAAYVDDFEQLSTEDKQDQVSQFAKIFTNVIIPSSQQPLIIEAFLKYREWDVTDASKAQIPEAVKHYNALLAVALKGAVILINQYNYTGKEFSVWFISLLSMEVCAKDYLSSYIDKPPTPHPSCLLQGEVYPVFFHAVIQNPVLMLYFMRDHGIAYIYEWLILWVDYVNEKNLTTDQDLRMNVLFPGLLLVMEVLDHVVLTCSHVATSFQQTVIHLVGLVTWWVSYLSVHEAKASGAHERYDLFAARLAQYHYWIVNYATHSRYRAVSVGYYADMLRKYQLFERQLVLHKNSVKYITPTYDLAAQLFSEENSSDVVLTPPAKLRPTMNSILTLPEPKEFPSFKDLCNMNDMVTSREYFDEKIERITKNPDDVASVFSEEDRDKQAVGPLSFFIHENKKEVDAKTVFGKIKYVSGALYDYRVKVVTNSPADLDVTMIKSPAGIAAEAGQWKSVTTGEDFKIKVVKSGTHDFTIKYKN